MSLAGRVPLRGRLLAVGSSDNGMQRTSSQPTHTRRFAGGWLLASYCRAQGARPGGEDFLELSGGGRRGGGVFWSCPEGAGAAGEVFWSLDFGLELFWSFFGDGIWG